MLTFYRLISRAPPYGHQTKEFMSSFKLTGGMQNPEELKEYRDKW